MSLKKVAKDASAAVLAAQASGSGQQGRAGGLLGWLGGAGGGRPQPSQRGVLWVLAPFVLEFIKELSPVARRVLFRFRQQTAPIGLLAIGAVGGAMVSSEGLGRGVLVSLAMAAVVGWWLRESLQKRPRVRRDAGVCVALVALWCVATAVLGFGATDVVGVVLWAVLAIAWWVSHGVRRSASDDSSKPATPSATDPASGLATLRTSLERPVSEGPVVESSPAPVVVSAVDAEPGEEDEREEPSAPLPPAVSPEELAGVVTENETAWANLTTKRQALKNIAIAASSPFAHGVSHTLQLEHGVHHIGMVQGELPWIASGLDYPLSQLLLEQHPDHKSPNVLRLQVVTKSPIEDTVYFDRPHVKNGRIRYGLYADGCGHSSFRLFVTNRMLGGFLLGSTNSGKSRLIEALVLSALWTKKVIVIYIDGQDGASSPLLYNHPSIWAGGPAEAEEMLRAIERGMAYRQRYNRAYRIPGFTPSADFPGILVIVEEAHRIYTEKNAVRHGYVSREGGKIGIAELAASQYAGLVGTFGNHDPLRSSLFAGNAIVLRTLSTSSNQMVPGLGLNPSELPAIPGYGVVAAAADDAEARSAPFRGLYIPDERDRAKASVKGEVLPVMMVEEWFDRVEVEGWAPAMDAGTARAFGPIYQDRHEIAARRQAALMAELEGGVLLPPPGSSTYATGSDAVSAGLDPFSGRDGSGAQRTMADAILGLPWDQHDGVLKRAQMFELLSDGANPSTVASALRALCGGDRPRLESVGDGVYRRKGSL